MTARARLVLQARESRLAIVVRSRTQLVSGSRTEKAAHACGGWFAQLQEGFGVSDFLCKI